MKRLWSVSNPLVVLAIAVGAGCGETTQPADPGPPPVNDNCTYVEALDAAVAESAYAYAWTCEGEVAASTRDLHSDAIPSDCTTGVWPDLDPATRVCPTSSNATRDDPISGLTLPPADDARSLPVDVPVTEQGSFRTSNDGEFPNTLRVVTWNMEYTAHLDEQIEVLTTHPELALGDVFLLNEVDRCSTRNDTRRAARLIAEALSADYVYGIEFVELNIGRDVGGDTGQAIVSRRPLSGAALSCHTSQHDWFGSEDEPRLGQRVFLHADVPVGETMVRLYALHLESNDIFGERRAVQSKELLDVSQTTACERPQVVAGDFNAPYCGAPELEVFRDAGFVDAMGVVGDVDKTHSNGFRLDYVFSKGFRVVDGGVVRDLGASDHDALWVDLELE